MDRARIHRIGGLALPIIGGMVSQNVLNVVDTAMVGTLGDTALAAVGLGSFANFLAMAFITGMAAGVQAMAARRKGEGKLNQTAIPLNGGLLLAGALAVPWSALLVWLAPDLFPFLVNDPAVHEQGIPYLQIRMLAMLGVGMNFAFRGYWNGVDLSRLYLGTLVVMHVVNIGLNWVLIFGNLGAPIMGASGAAWASTAATYVGTLVYVGLGLRHARGAGFLRGLPRGETLRTMLRLALPAGAQQFFMAAGFTALMWIVGRVGTAELAAANVLMTLTLVCILPAIGLGLSAATLVGQALGRGQPEDAKAWGWDVAKLGAGALAVLGLPLLLAPDLVLQGFLHDPHTRELARLPLQFLGAGMALDGVGLILLNALLGAGATRTVMAVSITLQWGLGLSLAYVAGPIMGLGLVGIWGAQVLYRLLQAVVFGVLWQRGAWAKLKL